MAENTSFREVLENLCRNKFDLKSVPSSPAGGGKNPRFNLQMTTTSSLKLVETVQNAKVSTNK